MVSQNSQKSTDSVNLTTVDSVIKKVIYVTQKGDTLDSIGAPVNLNLVRVKRDSVSFAAVGDIMMGTNFPNASYLPPNDGFGLWREVGPSLKKADITFGNLEGVILTNGGDPKECRNPKACFLFRTPEDLSFHFKDNGFDLLSIANNHANDFGISGRVNTQRVLDSLGINHAGSIEYPYSILKRKGMRIGFVAFAPNIGTQSIHDEETAYRLVEKLDSLTDIVIVSFHAGAEGAKNQRVTREREFYYGEDRGNVYEFSHAMIDHGADVILGHGPHIVRGLEVYKNRLIAYSLGNFLTYGRFNLRGPNAYAPVLNFTTDSTGIFLHGNIESFIQDYTLGPIRDDRNRAGRKIRELTEIDFPENEISIDDMGRILYLDR